MDQDHKLLAFQLVSRWSLLSRIYCTLIAYVELKLLIKKALHIWKQEAYIIPLPLASSSESEWSELEDIQ